MVAGYNRVFLGRRGRILLALQRSRGVFVMDEIERDIEVLSNGFLASVALMCLAVTGFLIGRWGGAW